MEEQENKHHTEQRSLRNIDRTVKDFQSQIERRDKMNSQLNDEVSKSRDKVERLLANIEELQQSESETQFLVRRSERELREEREKALRLERELDGWKGLWGERGSAVGRPMATFSDVGSRRGSNGVNPADIPQRMPSNTKGFL